MPECPPSGALEDTAGQCPQTLTPATVAALLADFRTWIDRAAAAGELAPLEGKTPAEPLDLHTLLSQFTALRHEVNLQTRSVRTQQELNIETLRQYGEVLAQVQAAQSAEREADQQGLEELLRPLLKNLVDAYDALLLARREVERVRDALVPALEQIVLPAEFLSDLPSEPKLEPEPVAGSSPERSSPGFLGRLFGRSPEPTAVIVDERWQRRAVQLDAWSATLRAELLKTRAALEAQQERVRAARAAAERVQLFFDSVLTGYTMSLQRLERTLSQCELEPIHCVGAPFDPELMEVVEVATTYNGQPNEVVEEVRRGYLWRGRVFRYAQVRVAR